MDLARKGSTWAARCLLAAVAIGCFSPADAAVRGKWINPSKSVIIEIAPCGNELCGTVIWASEKAKKDASRGTKHLVGTKLLTGMKPSGKVWKGKIFVPDQNITASAKLKLEGANHLKVSGCVMVICKSQTWTKTQRSQA